MRRRRTLLIAAAVLAIAAAARHPTADIEILTHEARDPAPHRMQAAVDLGIVAVKFLVTWSTSRVVS
ncbi:hypothetical protein FPZ24_01575 [Sphingomonas panacisoli]|uniref:Uncharacterized protein n=1 Tax=Sphingomonas panacisoli TaxID=1813879 RepID=A0A5B8LGS2_9SPHN|nr:hypothetical protein [Sphingomonas panacisoli]QDZ06320.1 hypothetical protein FPZ24_01575 [Sphingomonas panacisoli]